MATLTKTRFPALRQHHLYKPMVLRQIGLFLFCCLFILPPASSDDENAVWQALKQPGAVVVLRHSYAPGTFDPQDSDINDCTTQRNLDAEGRAQARAIGETFRKHNITVGDVLASPKCRTRDTGLLAFGRVENWTALRGARSNPQLLQQHTAQIHQRMRQHKSQKPMILITHGSIVRSVVGRILEMGEFVVMLPDASNDTFSEAGALFIRP